MQTNSDQLTALDHFRAQPYPLRLRCGVQHYAWGGYAAIPRLLGVDNTAHEPYAELWIGAHPDLPSVAELGPTSVPLDALVREAPETVLGTAAARGFQGRLPFLLKLLSARKPLSIQAHPNQAQALEGYAREDRLGFPRDDPKRNYRDPYHKPELICALDDFYALRGFRPLEEIEALLGSLTEFVPLARGFEPTRKALVVLYTHIMTMPQARVDALLDPLVERLRREARSHPPSKNDPAYWVLRADRYYSVNGHRDRGLFSIYLLNLVHLRPGEAMYLPAGELHAYLQGTGMEIMANSNNVLRGGLTPKHVDVGELLSILTFQDGHPKILLPHAGPAGLETYPTPAREFLLSRLRVPTGSTYQGGAGHGAQLALVLDGEVRVRTRNEGTLTVTRGDAYLVPYGMATTIKAERDTVIYLGECPAR